MRCNAVNVSKYSLRIYVCFMYNTLCLRFIKIKLVIYCIWLVSFHHSAHILYQFLIFFYFSFLYSKFCSKMYLIVLHAD